MNVWRFLTPRQIADVRARTKLVDCSQAIQTAILEVEDHSGADPDGLLQFPYGGYHLDFPLVVSKPIRLVGAGKGATYPPTLPPTELAWFGGAQTMLTFGANGGSPISGGGISGMMLNGRQIAGETLRIIDAIRWTFSDLALEGATERVLCLMNSRANSYPTGYGQLSNIWASTGLTGSNTAHALWVGSDHPELPVNGSDGVAMVSLFDCNFQSDQGASVKIVDRGDHFVWNHCSTGHQGGKANVGTAFVGNPVDPLNTVVSTHLWLNHTGDFYFARGTGIGQRIINLNMADVSDPWFSEPHHMISGEGASEVTLDTNIGYSAGQHKTLGYRQSIRHDAMEFMGHDAISGRLTTAQGTWGTEGTITDAKLPGGAVRITARGGEEAKLWGPTATRALYPNTVFSVGPEEITDVVIRVGWMQPGSTNGCYVEVDTAVPWQGWRFVCRNPSGQTVINSAYPFNIANVVYMFRIECADGAVNFYARDYAFQHWETKTISDHLPAADVPLTFVYPVLSRGSAKSLLVADFKLGFDTEESVPPL